MFRVTASLFLAWSLSPLLHALPQESTTLFDAPRRIIEDGTAGLSAYLDYDGDGVVEAISIGEDTSGVDYNLTFYENPGDGSFLPTSILVLIATGSSPYARGGLVGDVDGNAAQDLVFQDAAVTYLLVANGVTPIVVEAIAGAADAIALADVNGDGIDELLRVEGGTLTIRDGSAGWVSPPTQTFGTNVSRPLEVTELANGGIGIWTGAVSGLDRYDFDSAGNFTGVTNVPTSLTGGGVEAGDVNGDGLEDLLRYTDYFNPNALLLTQTPASTFVPTALAGVYEGNNLVDVDADGDLDLLGTGIQLNDGAGNFSETVVVPTAGRQIIDVDNDGDGDLVGPEFIWYSFDQRPTITGIDVEPYRPFAFYLLDEGLDLEGDGDVDFVPWQLEGYSLPTFGRNDGAGSLTRVSVEVIGDPNNPNDITDDAISSWRPADWDGDGDLDFMLGRGAATAAFLENLGPGASDVVRFRWNDLTTAPSGLGFYSFEPVDLDLDGDLDAIDTYRPHPSAQCFLAPGCLDTGKARTQVYRNTGGPDFETVGPYVFYSTTDVADVDGDGLPDLIVAADFTGIGWAKNLGNLVFDTPIYLGTEFQHPLHVNPGVADLDGDGDVDVAIAESSGSRILFNDGAGNFTSVYGLPTPTGFFSTATYGFEVDDYDLDGLVDLMYTDRLGSQIFTGDGAGGFTLHSSYSGLGGLPRIDLDHDGDDEYVASFNVAIPWFDSSRVVYDGRAADVLGLPAQVEQGGVGAEGAGTIRPVLGVSGTPNAGEPIELVLAHGRGGSTALLALGAFGAVLPDFPAPGITMYVNPSAPTTAVLPPIALSAGAFGDGRAALPVTTPPSLAGVEFFLQALVFDSAGPGGFSATRALRVRIGG